MTDLENSNNNPLYEFSIKLCVAIKKHKCLYDRIALHKNPPPPCQIAWQTVAKECGESVKACKARWRSLQQGFFQSLKRKGNRYYLHDQMDFLLQKSKSRVRKSAQMPNINDVETNIDESFGQQENNTADDEEPVTIADSDSHTTSADESNEMNSSRDQSALGVGGFIINELRDEADEDRKRLSYKRACKRGLDPDLVNDLEDDEPEEKKSRKSLANEEQDKQVNAQNKKFLVRMDKIKLNNKTVLTTDHKTEAYVETSSPKKLNVEVKTYAGQFKRSMIEEKKFHDSATQYDMEMMKTYDDIFLESIRSQLLIMNGRQKMMFKRKMYESLLEVFDDNTDFPKANEVLKAPPKAATKLINTTVGELRLMRELVSLVQAAKNTPEIIESKEKIKTAESTANAPAKPTATAATPAYNKAAVSENRSKASISSPLSLSPSLEEDDDLQFSLDNIDDEDDLPLPKSWDDIKAKTNDTNKPKAAKDNVMGLPKRVLQKVVRVAGSSGSTIVARDGDKKRIYRIYPKTVNNLPANAIKSASNVGTFYVGPNKTTNDTTNNLNKSLPGNISIRPMTNNSITINNSPQTSSNKTPTTTPTVIKTVNPGNRLLSPTTGYFKVVPTSKNLAPANSKITTSASSIATSNSNNNSTNTVITRITATKNPMLPPNLPTKRTVQIRSHVNAPQLMQRRYSICGPLPSEKSSQATSPKAFIINRPTDKSSVSQIHISQPISLNTTTHTSTNSNISSSSNNSSTVSSTTSNAKPAASTPEDVKPPKTLEKSQDSLNPLESLTVDTDRNAFNVTEEIPILETAGTIGADNLDPLFVKPPQIKAEPLD
ncbi:uncharacterized protein ACRADG_002861 [Cochliomyia hominivorax]